MFTLHLSIAKKMSQGKTDDCRQSPVYAYTSICFGVKCFDSFYIRNTFLYKQNDKGK